MVVKFSIYLNRRVFVMTIHMPQPKEKKSNQILLPNMVITMLDRSPFYYLLSCLKIAGCVANGVDTDQTPRSVAFDLNLHYLLRMSQYLG